MPPVLDERPMFKWQSAAVSLPSVDSLHGHTLHLHGLVLVSSNTKLDGCWEARSDAHDCTSMPLRSVRVCRLNFAGQMHVSVPQTQVAHFLLFRLGLSPKRCSAAPVDLQATVPATRNCGQHRIMRGERRRARSLLVIFAISLLNATF